MTLAHRRSRKTVSDRDHTPENTCRLCCFWRAKQPKLWGILASVTLLCQQQRLFRDLCYATIIAGDPHRILDNRLIDKFPLSNIISNIIVISREGELWM